MVILDAVDCPLKRVLVSACKLEATEGALLEADILADAA